MSEFNVGDRVRVVDPCYTGEPSGGVCLGMVGTVKDIKIDRCIRIWVKLDEFIIDEPFQVEELEQVTR